MVQSHFALVKLLVFVELLEFPKISFQSPSANTQIMKYIGIWYFLACSHILDSGVKVSLAQMQLFKKLPVWIKGTPK